MHLKAELAGKRGVCPRCGAKFDIPRVEAGAGPSGDAGPSDRSDVATEPNAGPITEGLQRPETRATLTAVPASTGQKVTLPAASGPGWFLRNPSGETYGPAPPEQLERWLAEGRVAAEAWVWSAPWSEWRQAALVFPGRVVRASETGQPPSPLAAMAERALDEAESSAAAETDDAGPLQIELALDETTAKKAVRVRRRQSETALAGLALVTLVLAGVLVWMLTR